MNPPHARPDPRYFPPEEEDSEPLAKLLLGGFIVALWAVLLYLLLWALS